MNTATPSTPVLTPFTIAIIVVLVVAALLVIWVASRGRLLPGEHVFRASRWTRGNRLFPSQVVITPASVTLYKPQWVGKLEESIHMAHVSSITIDTHVLFSDVTIETSGGRDPVICHGHTKGDAVEMKKVIEDFQSDLYRGVRPDDRVSPPAPGAPPTGKPPVAPQAPPGRQVPLG